MPKLLAAKQYPGLVDVYEQTTMQDPITGETVHVWDYDNPTTYVCNFMSLKGHTEEFGETYSDSDAVKLEVKPYDGSFINLSMRFGNIRMRLDETENYYEWVGRRFPDVPYYFNLDGMNPQVDTRGRIVSVEVYGTLAAVA